MNKSTLVLIDTNRNNFFSGDLKNAHICELYKSNTKANRIIRKIALKYQLNILYYFLSDWYKEKVNYERIILFDTGNAEYIVPIIKKQYPKSKIIVWFWNPVSKTINPNQIGNDGVELWSFDPADCKKFKLKYNTQFFIVENIKKIKQSNLEKKDVFFVGNDKGRIEQLTKLRDLLNKKGITYDFHIVGDTSKKIPGWNCYYRKPLIYEEVLKRDANSKVIIDIVSPNQYGLTLRPLEAIFLSKKLITNMKSIMNFKIYNSNNIFILGIDSENELNDFIKSPYDKSKQDELQKYYAMEEWIDRFQDNKEIYDYR